MILPSDSFIAFWRTKFSIPSTSTLPNPNFLKSFKIANLVSLLLPGTKRIVPIGFSVVVGVSFVGGREEVETSGGEEMGMVSRKWKE